MKIKSLQLGEDYVPQKDGFIRVHPDKIKVELFHTGAQGEQRLAIIAALRKWEAQRERIAA